jgi:hypothetical protein
LALNASKLRMAVSDQRNIFEIKMKKPKAVPIQVYIYLFKTKTTVKISCDAPFNRICTTGKGHTGKIRCLG